MDFQMQRTVYMMSGKTHLCTLNLASERGAVAPVVKCANLSSHQRLARACAWLEQLEWQRGAERHPSLGKLLEQRIIWRELLDLELQDLDDQIERVSARTGNLNRSVYSG